MGCAVPTGEARGWGSLHHVAAAVGLPAGEALAVGEADGEVGAARGAHVADLLVGPALDVREVPDAWGAEGG